MVNLKFFDKVRFKMKRFDGNVSGCQIFSG